MPKPNGEKTVDPFKLVKGVREDTLDSFLDRFDSDPKIAEGLLRRLTRVNPRLAQRALIEADKAQPDSPENALMRGVVLMLGVLAAEDSTEIGQSFKDLIAASQELQDLASLDIDGTDHGPIEAA